MIFFMNFKGTFIRYAQWVVQINSKRSYSNPFHNILKLTDRGFIQIRFPSACTEFDAQLEIGKLTVYCGFDPTADSLHIGNLIALIGLLHMQRGGHQPIALIGSQTASVGDPSGRNVDRPIIPLIEIETNASFIKTQINTVFENHEKLFWQKQKNKNLPPLICVDNKTWLKDLNHWDFLKPLEGMRLSSLLNTNTIKDRLVENVKSPTIKEFLYQMYQAYDWLYLLNKYNCTVQIGGSDQLGNVAIGHAAIKKNKNISVTGLLFPLITSELRKIKLGKSVGNGLWLNAQKTSPFELFQYFVRTPDSEVENLLKLFTFMSIENIDTCMKAHWECPDNRSAQKKLAEKVVLLVHGESGLELAKRGTKLLYGNDISTLVDMDENEIFQIFGSAIVCKLPYTPDMTIIDCAMKAECFKEKWFAEKVISEGGFQVNLFMVTTPNLIMIPGSHILPNNITVLRVGKKSYHIIRWTF